MYSYGTRKTFFFSITSKLTCGFVFLVVRKHHENLAMIFQLYWNGHSSEIFDLYIYIVVVVLFLLFSYQILTILIIDYKIFFTACIWLSLWTIPQCQTSYNGSRVCPPDVSQVSVFCLMLVLGNAWCRTNKPEDVTLILLLKNDILIKGINSEDTIWK